MLRVQGAERVTIQEHKRIVDCIAGHDPEGAAKAMTHHLTRAAKLYTRLGLVDGVPPER
jgi:DNA-binding FadR family transcriptional regulator